MFGTALFPGIEFLTYFLHTMNYNIREQEIIVVLGENHFFNHVIFGIEFFVKMISVL